MCHVQSMETFFFRSRAFDLNNWEDLCSHLILERICSQNDEAKAVKSAIDEKEYGICLL